VPDLLVEVEGRALELLVERATSNNRTLGEELKVILEEAVRSERPDPQPSPDSPG
jgi:hypothetical protein